MDVRDLHAMMQLHDPWLLNWVATKTGQLKSLSLNLQSFEALVAQKVTSITEVTWEQLRINADIYPSSVPAEGHPGKYIHTSRYYTVVWTKNDNDSVCYTGTQEITGLSVDKLLRLVLLQCEVGETPWITAVVETIYIINTASTDSPKHSFVIYPCKERAYMNWVDQNETSINQVLAQRGLILSSYCIAARKQ